MKINFHVIQLINYSDVLLVLLPLHWGFPSNWVDHKQKVFDPHQIF